MAASLDHHRARRLALQGLCCLDVQGDSALELFDLFIDESRERPGTVVRARAMLVEARAGREESDRMLAGESQHWDVARMALVDRNILRLAIWELLTAQAPRKVAIDEALKLAREFASAESARFINGVLDAASKRISRDAGDAGDSNRLGRTVAAEETEEEG